MSVLITDWGTGSKALKGGGRSGIRIIYAYKENEDKVTLIEAYYKGKKENEDREKS